MIKLIKSKFIKYSLAPNIFCIFEPFYFARYNLMKKIKKFSLFVTGKTLDIGCGAKQYEKFFIKSDEYVGIEIETDLQKKRKIADYFYDGKILPFQNNSFDSILCFQVLEHVFEPLDFLIEAKRVLKPGGKILITVPFIWDEHEQPRDYGRYSSFGLKYLFTKINLEVVKQEKVTSGVDCIFQLVLSYIQKKFFSKNIIINAFIKIFLVSPINFIGIIFNKVLPKNEDLYLDNIILVQKKND